MSIFTPSPPIRYVRFEKEEQVVTFPGLTFRVFYLEAPVSILGKNTPKSVTDEKLLSPNFYHVGVGFQSTDPSNPVEFTLDYELVTGFTLDAFLPKIVDDELIWSNQTETLIGNYIDRNYWIRSDYICDINNTTLVNIQNWTLESWNPQNPIYSLFSGVLPSEDNPDEPSRKTLFDPYMRSSTCNDYCFVMFEELISLGVCIGYVTPPMNNVNAFVSNTTDAIEVDYEENKCAIIDFYKQLESEINNLDGLLEKIEHVIEEIENAPPEDIPALVEELTILLIELLISLAIIYLNFDEIYYYGYHEDGTVGYWKYIDPGLYINYVEGNLYRSFSAITTNSIIVNDGYTKPDQLCSIESSIQEEVLIRANPLSGSSDISYWIAAIVLLIIFIIVGFYLSRKKKR